MAGRTLLSQRHDGKFCVVGGRADENDFLQFRRARAKIFFSFRARIPAA